MAGCAAAGQVSYCTYQAISEAIASQRLKQFTRSTRKTYSMADGRVSASSEAGSTEQRDFSSEKRYSRGIQDHSGPAYANWLESFVERGR